MDRAVAQRPGEALFGVLIGSAAILLTLSVAHIAFLPVREADWKLSTPEEEPRTTLV